MKRVTGCNGSSAVGSLVSAVTRSRNVWWIATLGLALGVSGAVGGGFALESDELRKFGGATLGLSVASVGLSILNPNVGHTLRVPVLDGYFSATFIQCQ